MSFCLPPSYIFLQTFHVNGTASIIDGVISFSPLSTLRAIGSAFLPSPLRLFLDDTCNTLLTFSTSFTIHMNNQGTRKNGFLLPRKPTGGLTFALVASPPVSRRYKLGGLGYAGTGVGLAVEFDVSQESWDPNSNHVGINTNGSVNSLAAADPPFSISNGQPTYVWIDFNGLLLQVFVSQGNDTKPDEPLLSQDMDLCSVLRPLPLTSASQSFYAGFTAESGMAITSQVVSNWCFTTGECPCNASKMSDGS